MYISVSFMGVGLRGFMKRVICMVGWAFRRNACGRYPPESVTQEIVRYVTFNP